jgi:hypothetical protein
VGRTVDTPYGPMPGCPDCGVIVLGFQPHVCEHGVTVVPPIEISATITFDSPEAYKQAYEQLVDDGNHQR